MEITSYFKKMIRIEILLILIIVFGSFSHFRGGFLSNLDFPNDLGVREDAINFPRVLDVSYDDEFYTYIVQGSDDIYYLQRYDTNFNLKWSEELFIDDVEYAKLLVEQNEIKIITLRQSSYYNQYGILLINDTQFIHSYSYNGDYLSSIPLEMDYVREKDLSYQRKTTVITDITSNSDNFYLLEYTYTENITIELTQSTSLSIYSYSLETNSVNMKREILQLENIKNWYSISEFYVEDSILVTTAYYKDSSDLIQNIIKLDLDSLAVSIDQKKYNCLQCNYILQGKYVILHFNNYTEVKEINRFQYNGKNIFYNYTLDPSVDEINEDLYLVGFTSFYYSSKYDIILFSMEFLHLDDVIFDFKMFWIDMKDFSLHMIDLQYEKIYLIYGSANTLLTAAYLDEPNNYILREWNIGLMGNFILLTDFIGLSPVVLSAILLIFVYFKRKNREI